MPKHVFRQMLMARRKELPKCEVLAASARIQEVFIASEWFLRAKTLALYAPIHNEVETSEVLAEALAGAKKVIYPAVDGQKLVFRHVYAKEALRPGAFGIPEPTILCPICQPRYADVIIIPGVAFDLNGRRVGYGKGFYDKSLHDLEGHGKLIGFCYDFQVLDSVSNEPHDVKMDLLITEKRVIRPRN